MTSNACCTGCGADLTMAKTDALWDWFLPGRYRKRHYKRKKSNKETKQKKVEEELNGFREVIKKQLEGFFGFYDDSSQPGDDNKDEGRNVDISKKTQERRKSKLRKSKEVKSVVTLFNEFETILPSMASSLKNQTLKNKEGEVIKDIDTFILKLAELYKDMNNLTIKLNKNEKLLKMIKKLNDKLDLRKRRQNKKASRKKEKESYKKTQKEEDKDTKGETETKAKADSK